MTAYLRPVAQQLPPGPSASRCAAPKARTNPVSRRSPGVPGPGIIRPALMAPSNAASVRAAKYQGLDRSPFESRETTAGRSQSEPGGRNGICMALEYGNSPTMANRFDRCFVPEIDGDGRCRGAGHFCPMSHGAALQRGNCANGAVTLRAEVRAPVKRVYFQGLLCLSRKHPDFSVRSTWHFGPQKRRLPIRVGCIGLMTVQRNLILCYTGCESRIHITPVSSP